MSISNQNEVINSNLNDEDPKNYKNPDYLKIKNLYPKAKPIIKEIKKKNKKKDSNSDDDNEEEEEEEEEKKEKKKEYIYEINQEFLSKLIRPENILNKQRLLNTISKLINESDLSKKLLKESENKDNIITITNNFIDKLDYKKIEKDNILYHIGETDDKFYFIIKGRMSQLKASKYHLKISFDEFISYLIQLQMNNENYILNKVLKANNKDIPIKSEEDIKKIYSIIFKKKLIEKISIGAITDNTTLEAFFKEYHQEFSDHKMSKKELIRLGSNRNKIIMGIVNREWDDYILEKCHPNSDDAMFFSPFDQLFKEPKRNYICYVYEISLNFEESNYFGDFSLDEEKIIRGESIKAEEDTTLAWISNEEYIEIVAPIKKMEKVKEIMLLNNSYFFKTISERIFQKNYFNLFMKRECSMNTVLFNTGMKPKSLIFTKKGKISLTLNCSIIELYNIIKLIYIKLNKVSWPFEYFQRRILTKEKLRELEKKYLNDIIFKKIKTFNKIFKFEIEKKRKFQISMFSDLEIIGLEEIYLKIPHITKGTVVSDKIVYYELPLDNLNKILQEELRNITDYYVEATVNRVLSLMERLNSLKQNYLNIAKVKSEIASRDNSVSNLNSTVNKSYDSNKDSIKINYSLRNENNISLISDNKLNINNSKTNIPQNFLTKKSDDYIVKNDGNDTESNYFGSRANSTKFKIKSNISSVKKKNDGENSYSSFKKISPQKQMNMLKSANRRRNLTFELENNKINNRAGSVKLRELILRKRREEEEMNSPNKKSDIIIIGNTLINIKNLKKKVNEFKTFDKIREMFLDDYYNENKNLNESNDIKLLFSSDIDDYIKIKKLNKKEILNNEKFNEYSINDSKLDTIKTNSKINNNISITTNENYIKNRNNTIDSQKNKLKNINKINITKLMTNPLSPVSINSLNLRNTKNTNKSLNIRNININKRFLTSTNSNNATIINQTLNTNTSLNTKTNLNTKINLNTNINTKTNLNINNDKTILSILPKIQQKSIFIDYLTRTSNIKSKPINYNKKKINDKIPEIIKDYYSQIRKGGCIPLITNKGNNTLFLRKYHKKYKDVEDERQNRSSSKNDKILPKINESQINKNN